MDHVKWVSNAKKIEIPNNRKGDVSDWSNYHLPSIAQIRESKQTCTKVKQRDRKKASRHVIHLKCQQKLFFFYSEAQLFDKLHVGKEYFWTFDASTESLEPSIQQDNLQFFSIIRDPFANPVQTQLTLIKLIDWNHYAIVNQILLQTFYSTINLPLKRIKRKNQ